MAVVGALSAGWMAQASGGPTVEAFKQAIERKFQKLRPDGTTERNVLFQDVKAGKSDGREFPFRATIIIRDYGPGYPANRYFGQTCVGRFEDEDYMMKADAFGGWELQGRMTPNLSTNRCQNNPSAGVSSIPLASLTGTPAPRAGATGTAPQAAPAAPLAAGGGSGSVEPGAYECWSSNRANLTLNFTIRGPGQYTGFDGKPGTFTMDAGSGRMTFKGGFLDGAIPRGYTPVYGKPHGHPTVSIRNKDGSETAFCEKR